MSYRKGRRFEWEVRRLLEERGWVVVRAARSRPIDLMAAKQGRKPLLIECKYDSAITRADREALIKLAEKAGARPILASRRRYGREIELRDLRTGRGIKP